MATSFNQKLSSLLDMDLNTEEVDELNRDITQLNHQSLIDYIKTKSAEIAHLLTNQASQFNKGGFEKTAQFKEQNITNSQRLKKMKEKQELLETPPQAEFIQFLNTFISYIKNLILMVRENKGLSKSSKIKLEASLNFMLKHLAQAQNDQRWIFKETEAVYTFLREYFNLLNDIRTKMMALNEQGGGFCCSSSTKKEVETKIDILEHKLFAFPLIFSLEPRKLIKVTFIDEKGFNDAPFKDLNFEELKVQIECVLMKDFPEMSPVYKIRTQKVIEQMSPKEAKVQAAPPVANELFKSRGPSKLDIAKELLYGFSSTPNHAKALKLFTEADQEGSKDAALYLGKIYAEGLGVRRNLEKAYSYFQRAHSNKITEGTYQLGKLIENNPSQSEDKAKRLSAAIQLYEQAAAENHSDALTDLGFVQEKGLLGSQKDFKRAEGLYLRAVELGNPRAMNNLASLMLNAQKNDLAPQNAKKIFELFDRSAKCGYSVAVANLGICYFKGIHVGQDYIAARQLFKEASDLNDVDGIFYTAYFLLKESSLSVSDEKYQQASKLLQKVLASNERHCDALYYMGYLHENGLGLSQDYKAAFGYYFKSVRESSEEDAKALYKLANMFYTGKGCGGQNKEKAFEYYLKASKLGDSDAQYILGVIHDEGIDVQVNKELAKEFFKKSALQGNTQAILAMSKLGN